RTLFTGRRRSKRSRAAFVFGQVNRCRPAPVKALKQSRSCKNRLRNAFCFMRMSLHGKLTLSILSLFLAAPFLRAQEGIIDADVDIPYKRFVLDNGLRLIVSEDNRAPIVA